MHAFTSWLLLHCWRAPGPQADSTVAPTGTPSYEALVYDHGVHVLLALAVLGPQTSSTRDKPNPLEAECIPEL